MRIKSNFRDYYDSVQQYVYGESSTYTRAWCSMNNRHSELLLNSKCFNLDSSFVVGFCGRIYGGVHKFVREERVKGEPNTRYIYDYVWSIEQWYSGRYEIDWMDKERIKARQKNFFIKDEHSIFIEENCPIFYIDRNYSVCCPLNPQNHEKFNQTLKSCHFEQIVSPEEAYTSLVDYIGFLGMEHKTIPEMSNDVKVISHGFDKHSFRH